MKKLFSLLTLFCAIACSNIFAQSTAGESFYTSFDSTRIYYEVKGDGYPVVLVHGFTGTSQGWKNGPLYADLLKDGYKVILMDLRGNGRSDKPHIENAYKNDAEAKDVIGLVNKLGIKAYDAVGYSRGSIVVSRLMVLDKRVHKAVMGGMGADFTNPNWERRIHAYKALAGDTTLHDVDDMMVWINKNPFDKVALMYQQKHQPVTSPAELAAIKMPVLLIDGSEDKTNGDVRNLQKLIPGSQISVVPGDHNNAGKTVQFSAAIRSFLK